MTVLGKMGRDLRYFFALRSFLRQTVDAAQARRFIEQRMRDREQNFLNLVEFAVYANPASPYLKLLRHAGIELADVRRLVDEAGLEGALEHLHNAGVYVSLDEFKGRKPVRRDDLEFSVNPASFDNPGPGAFMGATTSGSRGTPTLARLNFSHLETEADYMTLFFTGEVPRPMATWGIGLDSVALRYAKAGMNMEKMFSVLPPKPGVASWLARRWSWAANQVAGFRMPLTEFIPPDEVFRVARWLQEQTRRGTPAIVSCFATPAVRVCLAAREHGLDIAGTLFVANGEPFTPAKAEIVRRVGAKVKVGYAMMELGAIGRACGAPVELDEVHVFTDKLAVIQRERNTPSGRSIGALLYTSTLPNSPKIAINMESGDHGVLSQRRCGCMLEEYGFTTHLSGIRSYEKLTSDSVTFLGSALFELLEEVLPARFGGQVSDYQLVEEEVDGLPRVSIVVSPAVGAIDEEALVETALETLRKGSIGPASWTDLWTQGETLRVVRGEPYESRTKVLPLHILRAP
jgi:hypothetical protein